MHTRLVSLLLLPLLGNISVADSAPAEPLRFRMIQLPELGGLESQALAVCTDSKDTIHLTGWSMTAGGVERAVHWGLVDALLVEPLPVLDPSQASRACAYAYDGLDRIVGHSVDPIARVQAILWERMLPGDWSPIVLPPLAGNEAEATDLAFEIDSQPVIAGWSRTASNIEKACVWMPDPTDEWAIATLPHLGPALSGKALGVAVEDGGFSIATGWAADDSGGELPQAWISSDNGASWTRVALPLLPDGIEGLGTDPGCGNNRVWVAGSVRFPSGNLHAVRWESLNEGQTWTALDLGALPGSDRSDARAIKLYDERDLLFIAGTSFTADPPLDGVATLWVDEMGAMTAYAIGDLIDGTPPLAGYCYDAMCRLASGRALVAGTGRDPVPVASRTGPIAPHAFFLLEEAGPITVPPADPARVGLRAQPNPFQRTTTISFSVAERGPARLSLHDVSGRTVAVLIDRMLAGGPRSVMWRGVFDDGTPAPPGVYFARLEVGSDPVIVQKIVQHR